jgi:chemotaxis signal transduction protein
VSETRAIGSPDELVNYLEGKSESLRVGNAETASVRVAVARVGAQLCAFPGEGLRQVARVDVVVPVPGCPRIVAGLVPVGGAIIGTVDSSELLGIGREGARRMDKGHMLIYEIGGERVGVLVTSIEEVIDVPLDAIHELSGDREIAHVVSEVQYDDSYVPYVDLQGALSSVLDAGGAM